MNKVGTKFWLTAGVETGLFIVLFVIIAFTNKFEAGLFGIWIGGVVAVATQFVIGNVVASGQATQTSTAGADAAAAVGAAGKELGS
jgi:hypothetical protein